MTEQEIIAAMASRGDLPAAIDHMHQEIEHPAWQDFCDRMANRRYGHEALWDSWFWFQDGWECSEQRVIRLMAKDITDG